MRFNIRLKNAQRQICKRCLSNGGNQATISPVGHNGGDQNRLFYSFNLEDHVPANHLLRGINHFLDLADLRAYLAPFYSHAGRPSIDPELMIRMLIVGYCFGIRSERRLCEEVHLNLAYRWFCRLGIEDAVPEHSTFSKNRHGRFRESDAFRHVFETVLHRCINEGLVGGEGFAIDASVVKADAARARAIPGAAINYRALGPAQASRAVREYLADTDVLLVIGPERPRTPGRGSGGGDLLGVQDARLLSAGTSRSV